MRCAWRVSHAALVSLRAAAPGRGGRPPKTARRWRPASGGAKRVALACRTFARLKVSARTAAVGKVCRDGTCLYRPCGLMRIQRIAEITVILDADLGKLGSFPRGYLSRGGRKCISSSLRCH